jgi:hypothetical protein
MAIGNMQQAQQLRANGGIMTIPRQKYGLGSFVKKITRPLKKVLKSPLGMAALGTGLNMFGPTKGWLTGANKGLLARLKSGEGFFGNVGNMFRKDGEAGNPFSMGRLGLGALGLTAVAAPFLQKPEEIEEEEDWSITPGSISDIRYQARMRDPSLNFMPQSRYVQPNYYLAEGGIARLANGGGAGEQQMMQMLKAEYMKYRQNGGTMPFEQFAQLIMQKQQPTQTQMAADGGRIGFSTGSNYNKKQVEMLIKKGADNDLIKTYVDGILDEDINNIRNEVQGILKDNPMAEGGRIGYSLGGPTEEAEVINEDTQEVVSNPDPAAELNMLAIEIFNKPYNQLNDREQEALQMFISKNPEKEIIDTDETMVEDRVQVADGGMMDYMSSANPMAKSYIMEDTDIVNMYRPQGPRQMAQEGGLMNLGGMEKDYRQEGGFVPIGGQEKADDVPARLSKNEFVFTADAVRNAGGGDIDAGAEIMQNVMDNLEAGGKISKGSQGGNPAQEMFDTAQQLETRIG